LRVNIFIFILFLSIISCASAKKAWVRVDGPMESWEWRWCKKDLDGPAFHDKGICYISQKCKKKMVGSKCKPDPIICLHGDINCLKEYNWPKVKGR